MKTKLTIILCLLTSMANATIIYLGQATFTGDFTMNHLFSFNDPSAQPFGRFGVLTASNADGLFAQYIQAGSVLAMNTPNFYTDPLANPMIWQNGGFTLTTTFDLITGASSSCFGELQMTGNGFDPTTYGTGAMVTWFFTTPPHDVPLSSDVTGPIELTIYASYDNGHVPDEGATTLVLLLLALFALAGLRTPA